MAWGPETNARPPVLSLPTYVWSGPGRLEAELTHREGMGLQSIWNTNTPTHIHTHKHAHARTHACARTLTYTPQQGITRVPGAMRRNSIFKWASWCLPRNVWFTHRHGNPTTFCLDFFFWKQIEQWKINIFPSQRLDGFIWTSLAACGPPPPPHPCYTPTHTHTHAWQTPNMLICE